MGDVGSRPGLALTAAGLTLAGLSLFLAAPVGAAEADSAVQVTVNGEPVNVEAALSAAGFDVTDKSYTLCQTDGSSTQIGLTGWYVQTVLTAAGVSADQVSSVSIPRVSGDGDVVLQPADYDTPTGDFPDGPALLVRRTVGADETPQDDFFRPSRSANCASDPNGPDYVRTPNGAVLEVDIASGTQLQVSSSVDRSSLPAGQSAVFTGSVANPPAGEALNYRWHFGDGSIGTGATISHTFAAAGTYSVILTADSGAAAGGVATPLTVTVGSAPGSAGPAATASASARPKPGVTSPARRSVAAAPAPSPSRAAPVASATGASPTLSTVPSEPPTAAVPGSSVAAPVPAPVTAPVSASAAPSTPPSPAVTPSAVPALPTGVAVAGRLITLLGGQRPAATSAPPQALTSAALAQALGPHGTVSAVSHRWAPYAAAAALLLLLCSGAVAELRTSRQNDPR